MKTWNQIRGAKLAGMLPPSNVGVAIHTNGRWIFNENTRQYELRVTFQQLGEIKTGVVGGVSERVWNSDDGHAAREAVVRDSIESNL